jgi:hypothetical protein
MPATAREMAARLNARVPRDGLYDPGLSIALGTAYLKQLLGMFDGNVELALAGYNGGPNRGGPNRILRLKAGVLHHTSSSSRSCKPRGVRFQDVATKTRTSPFPVYSPSQKCKFFPGTTTGRGS